MISTLFGYLEHAISLFRAKTVKSVAGKIFDGIGKLSLPNDINDLVDVVSNTKWGNEISVAWTLTAVAVTLLAGPYVAPLLASPMQAILTLHFWWRVR